MQELFLLGALPTGTLVALGFLGVVVSLLLGRIVLNNLPGKCPPVWEGFPFVGGLLKFIEVSSTRISPDQQQLPWSEMRSPL